MSHFDGMSDLEIAALSDAQISRKIDLICAEAGVQLFVDPGPEPKPATPRDWELYKVGPYTFDRRDIADRVVALINSADRWCEDYHWNRPQCHGEMKRDESEVKVELVAAYLPETVHKCRAELNHHQAIRAAWDSDRKAAKKAYESRAAVADGVWNERHAAVARVDDRRKLGELFRMYMELANGDREVALRFLRKAQNLDESWQPDEPVSSSDPA